MRGLLADANVQGHLLYRHRLLEVLDLMPVLAEFGIRLATFPDLGLPSDLDDRALWTFCQRERWVLLTEDRNDDGPDSLQSTLNDSWREGHLPVLTLSNKGRFERNRRYAERVAAGVAELLYGIAQQQQYLDRPRSMSRSSETAPNQAVDTGTPLR